MARPFIIANGGSPGVKASVSATSLVTLTLDSTVGVRTTQWSVLSTDETSSVGDYTLATSGSVGQTCTFTSLGLGTAVIVKVVINSGLVKGLTNLKETTNTVKVFVPTAEGLEVGAAGETYESDSTFGTTEILNQPIRVLNSFTTSSYTNDLKRVLVSSTSNLALSGNPGTVDGVATIVGDSILLLAQSNQAENGIWTIASGAWTRPANFTTDASVRGCTIAVIRGTARAGFFYQNTNSTAVTVGSTSLLFARLPDRFDRADLAAASSTPASGILPRYGTSNELNAAYLSSNGANPASTGFIRAIKNVVGLAFRNDANTADIEAVTASATDVLRIGSNIVSNLIQRVKAGSSISLFDDADLIVDISKAVGIRFGETAKMTIDQEGPSGADGNDATIEAQRGDTGFSGGDLVLKSGLAGTGGSPGNVVIDVQNHATGSGSILFRAGSFGEFVGISFNDTDDRATLNFDPIYVRFIGKTIELDSDNVALCSPTGSFGSGTEMVFIPFTDLAPTTDPVGGGLLYVQEGDLKYRGPGGTITTLALA